MKELMLQYASYNLWAHKQLLKPVLQLSEEQVMMPLNSSFASVHATLLHLWDAEAIWWQRVNMKEKVDVPSLSFNPVIKEVADGLLAQSTEWLNWVSDAKELMLQHEFMYRNSKKEQFKQPTWQVLLHMFNHATYHRGQVVTLLRQLAVKDIPATDFIAWSRKH